MTTQTAVAKSLILEWFDRSGQPREKRGKLHAGIDRFFEEIASRDKWLESITILLDAQNTPRFQASNQRFQVIPCVEGLAIVTVVPGWGFGWSSVFRDEYVYETLSWLGHYARQYIHRSQVAKALMIAWERDAAILHPFGAAIRARRYGPVVPETSSKMALSIAVSDISSVWNRLENVTRSRSPWRHRNTLDPAIHQAIYHFIRAQMLVSSGFNIEALVAFDCVIQSLQTLNWGAATGDPRRNRADLTKALGLSSAYAEIAEHLYVLRNEFGAHAGGWRWWDAEEYADRDFMLAVSDLALRVLQHAADTEPDIRRIDPQPYSWNNWLLESFSLIFRAIWFPSRA
jgi:hypothetical protein